MVGKIALAAVALAVGTATAKTQREAEIAAVRAMAELEMYPPEIKTNPTFEDFAPKVFRYGMNGSVSVTKKGRLWATWLGGEDGPEGFVIGAKSDDGGRTWSAGYELDMRGWADYPDAEQGPDDRIAITWGVDRRGLAEIRCAVLTEEEIAAGKTIGKDNFGGVRVFRSVTAAEWKGASRSKSDFNITDRVRCRVPRCGTGFAVHQMHHP